MDVVFMVSYVYIIGGIGFFLLGMNLITDGLKAIAGNTLRKWLNRFTGGRFSAISTGAVITLLVQSSTATTLMTIGFVSAGMLTLLQAVGVIFGANLGTTSTGWIVSFIGLKFSISQFALPLIGIGMILNQFSRGKTAQTGTVLTGFGLLFVGIQFLQDGMSDVSATINLAKYSGDSIISMIILVFIGIFMTIVMQSSSAAVATTITVLASGVISLEQAALLVIGQNIGTTATAALAAIGASTPAKRTTLSHILFNVSTGLLILILFPLFMMGMRWFSSLMDWDDPAIILALFHTVFSLFGIIIFVPFMKQFVRFIAWLLPEKKSPITQYLDHNVVKIPSIAIETSMRSIKKATKLSLIEIIGKLTVFTQPDFSAQKIERYDEALREIQEELESIHEFVENIQENTPETSSQYIAVLHALDHLERMNHLALQASTRIDGSLQNHSKKAYPIILELMEQMQQCIDAIDESNLKDYLPAIEQFSQELAAFRKQQRANVFDVTAKGEIPVPHAFHYVQMILFVDGLAYHIWRLVHHLTTEEQLKKED